MKRRPIVLFVDAEDIAVLGYGPQAHRAC